MYIISYTAKECRQTSDVKCVNVKLVKYTQFEWMYCQELSQHASITGRESTESVNFLIAAAIPMESQLASIVPTKQLLWKVTPLESTKKLLNEESKQYLNSF